MSEKKDLKVAPEAKTLPDEALEGVAGGAVTLVGRGAALAEPITEEYAAGEDIADLLTLPQR